MTDIHMHIIPDVDDGAVNDEMALVMLSLARQEGIRSIFAASHSSAYDNHPLRTSENYARIRKLAARYFPDMKLYLGCEVYCDESYIDHTLDALAAGKYPTMNGTKYVLIEFSMWVHREGALRCVERMVQAGWIPIIAHMERYRYLRFDRELVCQFRELSALIQVNAYSAYEEGEDEVREWARWLLQIQMADFLGTDAHRTGHRPPNALTGLRWMKENLPADYYESICRGNARRLLNAEE